MRTHDGGTVVGSRLGATVGVAVGLRLGDPDGCSVGESDGCSELYSAAPDGTSDGVSDGNPDGPKLGVTVGIALGACTRIASEVRCSAQRSRQGRTDHFHHSSATRIRMHARSRKPAARTHTAQRTPASTPRRRTNMHMNAEDAHP